MLHSAMWKQGCSTIARRSSWQATHSKVPSASSALMSASPLSFFTFRRTTSCPACCSARTRRALGAAAVRGRLAAPCNVSPVSTSMISVLARSSSLAISAFIEASRASAAISFLASVGTVNSALSSAEAYFSRCQPVPGRPLELRCRSSEPWMRIPAPRLCVSQLRARHLCRS